MNELEEARFNYENGVKLFDKGRRQDAYLLFSKALELYEYYAGPLFYLGLIHYDREEYDRTLYLWKQAYSLDPKFRDLKYLLDELKELVEKQ